MSNTEKLYDNLSHLYEKIDDKTELKKLIKVMNSEDMRKIYEIYLSDSEKDYRDVYITSYYNELLALILKITNSIYNYTGDSTGLTDSEYDELRSYYEAHNKSLDITEKLVEKNNVTSHKYLTLRGTLDKIYKITDEDVLKNKSQKSLEDWVQQCQRRIKLSSSADYDLWNEEIMVMPKFDGVSCVFECDKDGHLIRALTRGDTVRNEAQDITHIFKDIFKPPFTAEHEYGLKTEIMMLDSDFDKVNDMRTKKFKNTRSIVASILNSDEPDDRAQYLKIIPLRYSYYIDGKESQQYLPPMVYDYPYIKCKLKDVDKIHEFAFSHKTVNTGLRCDGSVIRFTNPDLQKVLGREDNKQKFEVAFKFTEETAYSKVKDIKFTIGLFGRVNPIVIFKPVTMKGNKVQKASLGSYRRYKDLHLAKGDKIKILYDIIPYVDFDDSDPNCKRSKNEPIEVIEVCPECGHALEEGDSGNILYCANPHCPSITRGKILNYCKKMDIANISYATIEDFYNEGLLTSIADLYTLDDKRHLIYKIPGYGENKLNAIIDEINNHRYVPASVFFGSLGIEGISTKKFKSVFDVVSFEDLLLTIRENDKEYCEGYLSSIPGIKEKTAGKIYDGLKNNLNTIDKLLNYLSIIDDKNEPNKFSVVFTKVRDDDMEKFIKENGGEVVDSLTKNTSFVIVPVRGVSSNKTKKAESYNIPIVPIDEAKKYIKDNYTK